MYGRRCGQHDLYIHRPLIGKMWEKRKRHAPSIWVHSSLDRCISSPPTVTYEYQWAAVRSSHVAQPHVRASAAGGRPLAHGCFCVRLVFSQGELMTEGGWAGEKVTPASEEA